MIVSANYRQLLPDEIDAAVKECADAWKDSRIPQRQYDSVVRGELAQWRSGDSVKPFLVLSNCLHRLGPEINTPRTRLLEIGASSGYYSEVLKYAGFQVHYTGVDYSEAYKDFAEKLYPGIDFHVSDARAMPFHDDAYDVVVSGACIMHVGDYRKAIAEAARVAWKYVIFHRTPVNTDRQTICYMKNAYGVPVVEWLWNESEILNAFSECGLRLIHTEDVSFDSATRYGHRSYVLAKHSGLRHQSV